MVAHVSGLPVEEILSLLASLGPLLPSAFRVMYERSPLGQRAMPFRTSLVARYRISGREVIPAARRLVPQTFQEPCLPDAPQI